MTTKILLLNGPPRSGKDAAGEELTRILNGQGISTKVFKFAHALKVATHGAFFGLQGLLGDSRVDFMTDPAAFEEEKDEEHELFFGLTPRQAYIALSERLFKPVFGMEFFGRVLAQQIKNDLQDGTTPYIDVAIVTDSGFAAEARPLIETFGAENTGLIRITRTGTSFKGDSRGSIFLPELRDRQIDVENNSSLDDLGVICARAVEDMFGVLRS
jgi:hypothetical protein